MAEVCSRCGGTGFELSRTDTNALSSTPCACRAEQELAQLQKSARIPRRYDHCTLDEYNPLDPSQEHARRVAREWIDLWPAVDYGLLLQGPPGTGKTHLAVAIARALISTKGAHVLFYEQRELLKAIQGTFDSGSSQRESEILRPAIEAEILILDDLGAGRVTAWSSEVLHDIIAQRYNENRLMIITTNRQLDDEPSGGRRGAGRQEGTPSPTQPTTPTSLRDRLGDALLSRVYEMCLMIQVTGKDGMDYRRDIMNARIRR